MYGIKQLYNTYLADTTRPMPNKHGTYNLRQAGFDASMFVGGAS